ncbi:metal ABC transporter permease [Actinomyces sp. B33]|uniref:metal ABC transporter permease n=1 Tax=Actinomyces sp. B33 TaxID=2942131 RepID=UPI002340A21D|nr:metal ABC transporter permease [Actinomyces sp. B33]MDC4233711.1 metal ABC transporter permease [Actinomyces sp. B33]
MTSAISWAISALADAIAPLPVIGDALGAPYMIRPLLLLTVLGFVAGPVSTVVNLRRLEFNAEAMVHSVFPGIVVGAIVGGTDMIVPGAALAAVLVTIALTAASRRAAVSEGAAAVILTTFFSAGIIISLKKGDMSGQLEALMFGRLLEITDHRLAQSLLVCLVALVLIAVTWKEQVFVAHDRAGAGAAGISLLTVDIIINICIGAIVVAASSAVGVLLVVGFLIVPGAAARLLASTSRVMAIGAAVAGITGGWAGIALMLAPTPRPVSPQAAVALCVLAVFGACLIASRIRTPGGAR